MRRADYADELDIYPYVVNRQSPYGGRPFLRTVSAVRDISRLRVMAFAIRFVGRYLAILLPREMFWVRVSG